MIKETVPSSPATPYVGRRFQIILKVLLVMIVGLMALGAGVRAMNAGLSCPDWPLCFGKVIPDFHPAVWFEFVHRAYAGIVSILFFACFIYVTYSFRMPRSAKRSAVAGLVFLFMQILAGGLTVLWLVKWFAVTAHLLLATLFFCSVLWMYFSLFPAIELPKSVAPRWYKTVARFMPVLVFLQIAMGGAVASTYAGSVCVDWPMCNGQWVPTWSGPIGHQIIHRFIAYFLAALILVVGIILQRQKSQQSSQPWMTNQLLRLSRLNIAVVFIQVGIGIANLLLYIPPWVTVPHQSVAVILLAVNLRIYFVMFIRPRAQKSLGVSG
jgi:heme a synthase